MIIKNIISTNKLISSLIIRNTKRLTLVNYNQIHNPYTAYPYKFGGLNIPFQKNIDSQKMLKQTFSSDTFDGFKQAYRFILTALKNKDIQSLNNICENNLTKNIQFNNNKQVKIIGQDQQIKLIACNHKIIFGLYFQRDQNMEIYYYDQFPGKYFYRNQNMIRNPITISTFFNIGAPILLSYQILFKTKMRLVQQSQQFQSKIQQKQQIHSIQFQVEAKLKFSNLITTIFKIKQSDAEYFKYLLEDNYSWKIGDIDRTLKGNFNFAQQSKKQ